MKHAPLAQLPLDDRSRRAVLANKGVDGVLARSGNDPAAVPFGPGCRHRTLEDAVVAISNADLLWERDWRGGVRDGGRTARAVALLDSGAARTANDAARKACVDRAAVYRALQRRQRACCPTCGRPM